MKPEIPITEKELINHLQEAGLFTDLVQRALKIAHVSHITQQTKDGNSFLDHHLFPVVFDVLNNYEGDSLESAVVIALLHDVLEDDITKSEKELAELFPKDIVNSVQILTRQQERSEDSKKYYMRKIMESNYETRIVKLADRIINLELVQRLRKSNPEKFTSYLKETRELFLPLAKLTSVSYLSRIESKLTELETL